MILAVITRFFCFDFQACQSCELDVLIPLQFGCSKLVLVGDPEQLRTTILSQVCLRWQSLKSVFQSELSPVFIVKNLALKCFH